MVKPLLFSVALSFVLTIGTAFDRVGTGGRGLPRPFLGGGATLGSSILNFALDWAVIFAYIAIAYFVGDLLFRGFGYVTGARRR